MSLGSSSLSDTLSLESDRTKFKADRISHLEDSSTTRPIECFLSCRSEFMDNEVVWRLSRPLPSTGAASSDSILTCSTDDMHLLEGETLRLQPETLEVYFLRSNPCFMATLSS